MAGWREVSVRALDRYAEWIGTAKVGPFDAALVVAALYFAFQAISLALLSRWGGPGVGIDDAEQLIYMPYLQAGYGGSQPPIYTWINWAAGHVTGINVFTLKIVKYATFFIGLAAIYAAVRRLGYSQITASAALFGLMTVPQIVWESQRALSHSVAAICFSSVALLAMVHLIKRPSTVSYVLLGLAMAAALLAKYNSGFFLIGLIAAAMSMREVRRLVLTPWFLLTIAVALLAMTPTILWNLEHPRALLQRTEKFGMGGEGASILSNAVDGLAASIVAGFNFSIVTVLVFAVGLWIAGLPSKALRHPASTGDRLLWRTLAFGALLVLVVVLASGATTVRDRWLLPVLFLLPAALATWMEPLAAGGRHVQRVAIVAGTAAAILVTPALWNLHLFGGSGLGSTAVIDYRGLEAMLDKDEKVRTIVSEESWIGNFRQVDENLVLLTEEVPGFATLLQDPAVLMWLDVTCPPEEVMEPIFQAGYMLDERIHRVEVPGRSGGTRSISFIKLKKQSDPATASPEVSRLCSQWWLQRR